MLKVATWNCQTGVDKHVERLRALELDLAIIQECRDPAGSATLGPLVPAGRLVWCGEGRGVAACTFFDLELRP